MRLERYSSSAVSLTDEERQLLLQALYVWMAQSTKLKVPKRRWAQVVTLTKKLEGTDKRVWVENA